MTSNIVYFMLMAIGSYYLVTSLFIIRDYLKARTDQIHVSAYDLLGGMLLAAGGIVMLVHVPRLYIYQPQQPMHPHIVAAWFLTTVLEFLMPFVPGAVEKLARSFTGMAYLGILVAIIVTHSRHSAY